MGPARAFARRRAGDAFVPCAIALLACGTARAQEAAQEPPASAPASSPASAPAPAPKLLAVRADWVMTMAGDGLGLLENALVLIEGGKIRAVGVGLEVPAGAEVLDLPGTTLAPGFLDARSALALDPAAIEEPRAIALSFDALDAVDVFAAEEIAEALENGITAVHVRPGRRGTLAGRSAVLKLKPGRPLAERVVRRGAGLRGAIGAAGGTLARLGEVRTLREQLRAARKYREAWEDYREARREFEEERAKRIKEGTFAAASRPAEERAEPPATRERGPGPGRRRPPRDAGEAAGEAAEPSEAEVEEPAAALQERREPESRPAEKKEEPLKAPDKPAFEPDKEVLLELIDRRMPLWVEAHRAEDLLNALAVAKEFDLDLVLEGATEAPRVAKEIAAREAPVVLGPPLAGEDAPAERSENDPAAAARLKAAGVRIAIGSSGREPAETRFLPLHAALAASAGLDPVAALRAITVEAARLCGVADRLGTIEPGKDADLVLFDGDPLRTGTKARAVLVDGEVVFRR